MGFFRVYGLLTFALAFTAFSIWNSTDGGKHSWAFVVAGVGFIFQGTQRAMRLKGDGHAR